MQFGRTPIALPGALRETSGVATGIRNPSLVWTHNDRGRGPVLYAVARDGHVHARIELNQSNDDWEDVARGRCDLGAPAFMSRVPETTKSAGTSSLFTG